MNQKPGNSKPHAESAFVSVRIDRQRFETLKEIALREDRPLASVVRRALDREFELDVRDEKAAA